MQLASLACCTMEVSVPTAHLGLPSDLFPITLYCDEELVCRQPGESEALEVVVSTVRSGPGSFQTEGTGGLAIAMLTPLGMLSLLRAPMHGLADRRVPLEHFCGRSEQRKLRSAVMSAKTNQERIEVFGRWLEAHILDSRPLTSYETRIAGAAMTLLHTPDMRIDLDEIARANAITRRQLERDFRKWLGVSPASYVRLVRFQRAARALAAGKPIVEVAADEGYADQAHMTRVFRETCWMTPRELAQSAMNPARRSLQTALANRILMADAPAARQRDASAQVAASGLLRHLEGSIHDLT